MNDLDLLKEIAKRRNEIESLVDGFSGNSTKWKLANNVMNGYMTLYEAAKYLQEVDDA